MKKNYIINIILVLSIIGCTIAAFLFSYPSVIASASVFYDNDGFVVIQANTYASEYDYSQGVSSPVFSGTIPSGYRLVARGVWTGSSSGTSNRKTTVTWLFLPSDCTSFISYLTSSGNEVYKSPPSGYRFFWVSNDFNSSHAVSNVQSGYQTSNSVSAYSLTCYIPVYDSIGDLVLPPNTDSNLIDFSIVGVADGVEANISPRSGSLGTPYDVYLFPSSFPLDGGVIYEHLTSSTYITELTASQQLELEDNGFSDLLDRLQNYYNDEMAVEGSTWFKGIPQIHFFAECQDHYINTRFNPDSYNLPYALISSFSRNSKVWLKRSDFIGGSRVYSYDHLCLIVVAHGDNNDTITRYDFTPALLSDSGVNPPSQISDLQGNYTQPTVSDFQELADYMRYCFSINDNHRDIENANMIANLMAIPWSNFIAGGLFNGQLKFLPHLSAEFDSLFNGLFDDYFVPDLDDIEEQVNADEAEFSAKFVWVTQIKQEVNFIVSTPLQSSGSYEYKIPIRKWGIEEDIIVFDTDWVPSTAKEFIKIVFDVFGTIALVFYIFKTLPSTLGNMPSD